MTEIIRPNYWHRLHETCDTRSDMPARLQLLEASPGEAISAIKSVTLKSSVLVVADVVAATIQGVIHGLHPHKVFVEGSFEGQPVFVSIEISGSEYDPEYDEDDARENSKACGEHLLPEQIGSFSIFATGSRKAIATIFAAIDTNFDGGEFARVDWWYKSDRGLGHRTVYLPPLTTKLVSEFYPDLNAHPSDFLKGYLNSQASVLLMAGQPGTGKTTMLRHMICENKLKAHVIYDEALMTNDQIFQTFLFGESDVLIIEDADTILSARERHDNKLMARFLNVSDGLIKLPDKKLVFTTNITDFGKVDPALLRPGRCFGVLHTRPLDLQEAQAAAKAANLPVPMERKTYTLAELFNSKQQPAAVRKIGFAS